MSREEAAAIAVAQIETGDDGVTVAEDIDRAFARTVLAASDAHDAAHGIHRVSLDDATVERAARVVHNFLNKNYPCGCGPDEMCPGNSYEATHIARAVLAAAVEAGQ